jgi:hypothetical protein
MRTLRSAASRSCTGGGRRIVASHGDTRVHASAGERQMGRSVPEAHPCATCGGARMEVSGASSRRTSIGRPQSRQVKVARGDSGSSLAAAVLAVMDAASTGALPRSPTSQNQQRRELP